MGGKFENLLQIIAQLLERKIRRNTFPLSFFFLKGDYFKKRKPVMINNMMYKLYSCHFGLYDHILPWYFQKKFEAIPFLCNFQALKIIKLFQLLTLM